MVSEKVVGEVGGEEIVESEREVLQTGDIRISLLAKEYYCRHCSEYSIKCRERNHRYGIWFLLRVTVATGNNERARYFIVGEGEREHRFPFDIEPGELRRAGYSGAEYWQYGHVTCGGWHSISSIFELDKENLQRALEVAKRDEDIVVSPKLNEDEEILLANLINSYRQKIVQSLYTNGSLSFCNDWGLWRDLVPLIKVYIRVKDHRLPYNASIEEFYASYLAKFRFGSIEIPISKGRYTWYHYHNDIAEVCCKKNGERYTIEYTETMGRKIVYHYPEFAKYNSGVVTCEEEYNGQRHATAEIRCSVYDVYRSYLFFHRLGDVMFIPTSDMINTEELQPATDEQFEKIQVVKGSIEEQEDGKKLVKKGSTLYHPEHGVLEIDSDSIAYQVPYYRRGHD